jgi:hypothetical protein
MRCALFLVVLTASGLFAPLSEAAEVLETQSEHVARLAAEPGAGSSLVIDFESLPFGTELNTQFSATQGVEFSSPASVPLLILPEAFDSAGIGLRLVVAGYPPLSSSELVIQFDEPQRSFATFFVDVGAPLDVEIFLGGNLEESFALDAQGEDLDGGVFRAVWFDTFADEVRLVSGVGEDGVGLDNFSSAEPGTVDNDFDGFADADGDCDDADPLVNPSVFDGCDGVDSDCNGIVDDGNDNDGDGFADCAGDCDDTNPTVFPGASELCDGLDNDCDSISDNAPDLDGDGFGACDGDCDDSDTTIGPFALEVCNDGLDNDCDGLFDESPDADGDGFTVCEGDCDDADPTTFPGAGCPPGGDDDDTTVGDDDDTTVGDDDDTTVGDDDDTTVGDDDDTTVGDDDDTTVGDDDDTTVGDDDDTTVGDDDDTTVGDDDDDDSAGDDDDSAGDDDDSAGDDDDSAGDDDDDDTSGDDDDTSVDDDDDDDSAVDDDDISVDDDDDDIGLGPIPGIAGGGCECQLSAPLQWNSKGLALLLLFVVAVLPRRRR